MNGEVKSYKLNSPMTWEEFKAMPDDIKVSYIKALRQKYDCPDVAICEMMGASKDMVSRLFIRLGLRNGVNRGKRKNWDKEGWIAFVNGIPSPATKPVEETPEAVAQPVDETPEAERGIASLEDIADPVPVREEKARLIPYSGTMTLEGRVEDVLNTVSALLGGASVHISITWDVMNADASCPYGERKA